MWQAGTMSATSPALPLEIDERSPRYAGWRVVGACFIVAVFCWGFGLYGHGVYLVELQRLHGWPASLIASAASAYYLLSATLVIFISDAVARLGPRAVVLIGAACMGSGRRAARGHHGAVAALRGLSHARDRRGGDAYRRDHHHRRTVVRPAARAGDQSRAQRRELRRHPGHARAGDRDRAVRIRRPPWSAPPRSWR